MARTTAKWNELAVALAAAAALSACSSPLSDQPDAILTDCKAEAASALVGLDTHELDPEHMCREMRDVMAGRANVGDLQALVKAVNAINDVGVNEPRMEIADDLPNIIRLRGTTTSVSARDTLKLMAAMTQGTATHIPPREMRAFFQNAGAASKDLSDEGIMNLAGTIERSSDGRR